jgi:hypothetical protein
LTGFVPAGAVLSQTGAINGTIVTASGLYPDLVGTTVTGAGVASGSKVVNFISSTQVEVDISQTVGSTPLIFTAPASDMNNATVRGVAVRLNPSSPITKSPYVSNCSAITTGDRSDAALHL